MAAVSILDMVLAIVLAFGIGLFIFFIYKKTYAGVMYSSSFGVTLVALTMITTLVILAVTSNVVLSLGMVGALSIVRFRAAIKDPLDVGFLFWAIVVGIACGAGLFTYSILCTLFIALVYVILTLIRSGVHSYLLVLCYDSSAKESIDKTLAELKCRRKIKSLTHAKGHDELTVQLMLNKEDSGIVDKFDKIDGVSSAMMVEYTGDV